MSHNDADVENDPRLPCSHCGQWFHVDELDLISGDGQLCEGCFGAYTQGGILGTSEPTDAV